MNLALEVDFKKGADGMMLLHVMSVLKPPVEEEAQFND
jgi:hypothetical protein